MLKKSVILLIVLLATGLTLVQAQSGVITVPGNRLADKLVWLQTNAQSNSSYIIELNADEIINHQTLAFSGKRNVTVTLRGVGANRALSNYFTVDSGVTLVLDNNITLRRGSVLVNSGGTLIMNNGSAIIEHYNSSEYTGGGGVRVEGTFTMNGGTISSNAARWGGGVSVQEGGTFTMNGGTISDNRSAGNGGGGVSVGDGTFTMNDGKISGNTGGGGVVVGNGTFTMNGGTISDNESYNGGGVSVQEGGTFTMRGGTISGNIVTNYYDYGGGGVYVGESSTFAKTGGTITGYASDTVNGNVVKDGDGRVQSGRGHAVYAYINDNTGKRKEGTAGPRDNLSYDGTKSPPTASGAWDN